MNVCSLVVWGACSLVKVVLGGNGIVHGLQSVMLKCSRTHSRYAHCEMLIVLASLFLLIQIPRTRLESPKAFVSYYHPNSSLALFASSFNEEIPVVSSVYVLVMVISLFACWECVSTVSILEKLTRCLESGIGVTESEME